MTAMTLVSNRRPRACVCQRKHILAVLGAETLWIAACLICKAHFASSFGVENLHDLWGWPKASAHDQFQQILLVHQSTVLDVSY